MPSKQPCFHEHDESCARKETSDVGPGRVVAMVGVGLRTSAVGHEKGSRKVGATLLEEQAVRVVVELGEIRIPELIEKRAEFDDLLVRHLECGQHPAEVSAVVAIVEEADV